MELRHIKLFCLIREHGGISRAAQAASLSQPTVSQHLKALEAELGTSLFHRMGRRMVPTQAGETFYPFARKALNLMEEARRALDDHLGLVRGELWIGGSTVPAQYILPRILTGFHERHPNVKLHLEVGDSGWVVERVRRREVELGFVGARLDHAGLSFHPFAQDELILVVPSSHPLSGGRALSLAELPCVPLLSRERGSGTRASWEMFLGQAGVNPASLLIVAELGSTEALVRGMKSGMGVGVVSLWAVEEELREGTLVRVPLDGPRMERTFYLVQNTRHTLSPASRAFMALVLESAPDRTAS